MSEETAHVCVGAAFRLLSHQEGEVCPGLLDIRGETESALSKADSRRESIGGYDQSAYLFHVSHVHYENRELGDSIKAMKQSIKTMPLQERQGRLHANAVLAQRQFEFGHIEESCASWETFLNDYMVLSTARGDEHFDKMRKSLARHRDSRAVRGMSDRIRLVAAMKA
ncbi:hypothetical protein [Streptomyces sp. CB02488]|uniref:hypothetical protein n=1 Tax=Streptomyces sp. CB02488 TaxID=1703920 RepID=UPI000AF14132|nr:hypothetical protein [Streptomyces sp. CB02488]